MGVVTRLWCDCRRDPEAKIYQFTERIMICNVLQFLERSETANPGRIALDDGSEKVTYREYAENARKIGTFLAGKANGCIREPIAVLIDRNIRSVCAFMGVVYSGNFYVPIDMTMPESRIRLIFDTLHPMLVLDARSAPSPLPFEAEQYDAVLAETQPDEKLLSAIRRNHIDTDPLYAIFTSGSTGVPKGVLINHRSVIDLVNAFGEAFSLNSDLVFGNQAPFDFDVSVKDIYNAMALGSTIQVLPRKLFKMPKLLVNYLREKQISILIWAVSALRILADFKALDGESGLALQTVMFSGEVMPTRALNYWMDHLPDIRYVNLYGPTEITCNCTYHIISRRYRDDESLPIGKAFANTRVFLLDENRNLIQTPHQTGEICIEGTCLAAGYWNNREKTAEAFILNPFVSAYESRIYKSGDMGYYNEDGDLFFASRRDYQIKHMGHRIELGEIEVALNAIPFITIACCIYDEERERIICHYQAEQECKKEIVAELAGKLPKYMWPNVYTRHDALPLNKNGKIDRIALKNQA